MLIPSAAVPSEHLCSRFTTTSLTDYAVYGTADRPRQLSGPRPYKGQPAYQPQDAVAAAFYSAVFSLSDVPCVVESNAPPKVAFGREVATFPGGVKTLHLPAKAVAVAASFATTNAPHILSAECVKQYLFDESGAFRLAPVLEVDDWFENDLAPSAPLSVANADGDREETSVFATMFQAFSWLGPAYRMRLSGVVPPNTIVLKARRATGWTLSTKGTERTIPFAAVNDTYEFALVTTEARVKLNVLTVDPANAIICVWVGAVGACPAVPNSLTDFCRRILDELPTEGTVEFDKKDPLHQVDGIYLCVADKQTSIAKCNPFPARPHRFACLLAGSGSVDGQALALRVPVALPAGGATEVVALGPSDDRSHPSTVAVISATSPNVVDAGCFYAATTEGAILSMLASGLRTNQAFNVRDRTFITAVEDGPEAAAVSEAAVIPETAVVPEATAAPEAPLASQMPPESTLRPEAAVPEPVASQEPAAVPEPMASQESAAAPEPVASQEPAVAPEPMASQEPAVVPAPAAVVPPPNAPAPVPAAAETKAPVVFHSGVPSDFEDNVAGLMLLNFAIPYGATVVDGMVNLDSAVEESDFLESARKVFDEVKGLVQESIPACKSNPECTHWFSGASVFSWGADSYVAVASCAIDSAPMPPCEAALPLLRLHADAKAASAEVPDMANVAVILHMAIVCKMNFESGRLVLCYRNVRQPVIQKALGIEADVMAAKIKTCYQKTKGRPPPSRDDTLPFIRGIWDAVNEGN